MRAESTQGLEPREQDDALRNRAEWLGVQNRHTLQGLPATGDREIGLISDNIRCFSSWAWEAKKKKKQKNTDNSD